ESLTIVYFGEFGTFTDKRSGQIPDCWRDQHASNRARDLKRGHLRCKRTIAFEVRCAFGASCAQAGIGGLRLTKICIGRPQVCLRLVCLLLEREILQAENGCARGNGCSFASQYLGDLAGYRRANHSAPLGFQEKTSANILGPKWNEECQ